jgi:nucleoside-diphosphate-sugar epimerase
MKNFFISGATGFIGDRLVESLKDQDVNLKILSRSKQQKYDTVLCDLSTENIPNNALDGIDIVFHLAGYAHDLSNSKKLEKIYQSTNVDSTIKLAKLAVKKNVKKFIFLSSVKAGGSLDFVQCMSEKDQRVPLDIYGKSKREAEIKLLEIASNSNMEVCIVRSALVYGPKVKGNLRLLQNGIKKGWFPPLPEVNNRRSMIHVDDLIRVLLMLKDLANCDGQILIATDGQSYSSRQIYEDISIAIGKKVYKWALPILIFNLSSKLIPGVGRKLDKLFKDECYSSEKLQSLGFAAKMTLRDMNVKIF